MAIDHMSHKSKARTICKRKQLFRTGYYNKYTKLQNPTMNITSPSCVSDFIHYVDGIVHSPTPSVDESDNESLHHLLVEQWFRDRFFLPRPYRSTSIVDDDEDNTIKNDIVDDTSCGRSMALFNDSLVSREIRSSIVSMSMSQDSQDSCNLRHRWGLDRQRLPDKRRPPLGVVMVVDTGAPLMPISRDQDNDERMEPASHGSFDDKIMKEESAEKSYDYRPASGFINRTFSFDEQLPVIHRRRGASVRKSTNKCIGEDDDRYVDEQPSFTIPITYSSDGSNQGSKVVYPVSVPTTP